uniref:Uncharacterized protein n=1 Tax=Meloidogyne hapla TaxID=6305 RepID=A0A1I8B136_MELHA
MSDYALVRTRSALALSSCAPIGLTRTYSVPDLLILTTTILGHTPIEATTHTHTAVTTTLTGISILKNKTINFVALAIMATIHTATIAVTEVTCECQYIK